MIGRQIVGVLPGFDHLAQTLGLLFQQRHAPTREVRVSTQPFVFLGELRYLVRQVESGGLRLVGSVPGPAGRDGQCEA